MPDNSADCIELQTTRQRIERIKTSFCSFTLWKWRVLLNVIIKKKLISFVVKWNTCVKDAKMVLIDKHCKMNCMCNGKLIYADSIYISHVCKTNNPCFFPFSITSRMVILAGEVRSNCWYTLLCHSLKAWAFGVGIKLRGHKFKTLRGMLPSSIHFF